MKHWIIDRDVVPLRSWVDAFPLAKIVQFNNVSAISPGEQCIIWVRCRSNELLDTVMEQFRPSSGHFIVVLADEPNESTVARALALGASGCCNTYSAPDVLRQVALVVQNGGFWVGQALLQRIVGSASRLLGERSAGQLKDSWSSLLSDREAQVARLVASGASNKEIAEHLFITERTVKAHLSAIFEKLDVRDRLQLSLRINGLKT